MSEYKYNPKKVAYDTQFVREHYDVVTLKFPKGLKEKMKEAAAKENKSMNIWAKDVIEAALKE